jgi:uncharacterized protein (DUF433 family)
MMNCSRPRRVTLKITCEGTRPSRLCADGLPTDHPIEPGKRGGKPCIRGLRMTVTDIFEYLASGMTVEEMLADFPGLTADDIRACHAYAADRERRLQVVSPG